MIKYQYLLETKNTTKWSEILCGRNQNRTGKFCEKNQNISSGNLFFGENRHSFHRGIIRFWFPL